MRRSVRSWSGPRRAAYTLVEMVVVISLITVISTLGAVIVAMLLRVDLAGSDDMAVRLTLLSLDRQFRDDVHMAASARSADPSSLILEFPDGRRVQWSVQSTAVVRDMTDGDSSRRDTFQLPDGETELRNVDGGSMIELVHRRRNVPDSESAAHSVAPRNREIRMLAAMGRDKQPPADPSAARGTVTGE